MELYQTTFRSISGGDLLNDGDLVNLNDLLSQLSAASPQCDNISSAQRSLNNCGLVTVRFEGALIGMTTVVDCSTLTGKRLFIHDVIVAGHHRGHGLAEEMMRVVHTHAIGAGYSRIELTSKPQREAANHLYIKLGYVLRNSETNLYCLYL
ncbi:GNAT family N-acetyltransferase [Patescibacteria group bacterium]|nr:GNAT family N-acetyltransferase [Patescibacteria group bacterium]